MFLPSFEVERSGTENEGKKAIYATSFSDNSCLGLLCPSVLIGLLLLHSKCFSNFWFNFTKLNEDSLVEACKRSFLEGEDH